VCNDAAPVETSGRLPRTWEKLGIHGAAALHAAAWEVFVMKFDFTRPVELLAAGAVLAVTLWACGTASSEPVSGSAALEQEDQAPPPLPSPTLAVPAGNRLALSVDATGVQIYSCKATATGFAWTFVAPRADLFDDGHELVGKHFAGPTWEWLDDGSTVVGAKVAGFTPDPAAIPWLLLSAASHGGQGRMSKVSYIQRLQTTGGLAPASGCDASHVGAGAEVAYTARYYFYRPTQN
jgi:hypothetical protein